MILKWMCLFIIWAATGYFTYCTFYGPRGYFAWQEKKEHWEKVQQNFHQLQVQKKQLSQKIQLMQRDIDLDLLEQMGWQLFRYIEPDKKVILLH